MKTVLHIVNFFNPGGSALTCYELAKTLPQYRHVFIGCIDGSFREKFAKLGVTYLYQQRYNFDYDFDELKGVFDFFSPDVIHVYIPGGENPLYFKNLPDNCKKVCTVLCGQKIGFDIRHFDEILFLSEYARSLNNGIGRVIRPGIRDTIPFLTSSIGPTFGRVSAFCPSKKIMDTVKCAERCPEYQFIIGGEIQDANYFNEIRNYIDKRSLENVELKWNLDEEQKEEILRNIDVLHYPTSNETFCFSIVEAMARGLAIISYDNSAIRELNHNDNIIFAEEDQWSNGLVSWTKRLGTDSELLWRYQQLNRTVYEQHYMVRRYGREISEMYET